MQAKMFEVRDRGTFIPIIAMRLKPTCEAERYLLTRGGFGILEATQASYLLVCKMTDQQTGTTDPFGHGIGRTLRDAHRHLEKHFDELETGSVICVEFLNGERAEPKTSEAANDSSGFSGQKQQLC